MSLFDSLAGQLGDLGAGLSGAGRAHGDSTLQRAVGSVVAPVQSRAMRAATQAGGSVFGSVLSNAASRAARTSAQSVAGSVRSSLVGAGALPPTSMAQYPFFRAASPAADVVSARGPVEPLQSSAEYMNTPLALLGGVTPDRAAKLHEEWSRIKRAKAGLWLIQARNLKRRTKGIDPQQTFNMLAVEVSFAPTTVDGEKTRVGSALMDHGGVTGAVEMQITTYDTERGFLKRWFEEVAGRAVALDGTVGLPIDYLVGIRVLHQFFDVDDENSRFLSRHAYKNEYLMRPANMQITLSREDHGLERVQMNFTQGDTFMRALF